ncbi:MAG TPA: F0F1 ATP synthase subunit A [Longimicrobium sp.]|nr:F0F1 ATP synthase subunit A [Longimicrobium sp.]
MKLNFALLALLLAAAPAAAQGHAEAPAAEAGHGAPATQLPPAATPQPGSVLHAEQQHGGEGAAGSHADEAHGAAAGGHGEGGHEGEFDPMHHVQDGNTLEFKPFGEIHLPAKGSWMVGPVDMTPTRHVVFLWITAAVLLLLFIPAGLAAKRRQAGRSPGGKRHNAIEAAALYIREQVVMPNIGHGGEKYAGYLITLFFFILVANLLGLVPFGATATGNIAVTAALALITFVVVEVSGMVALGPKGYLQTIVYIPHGLPKWLVPIMALIMTPVEILGKLAKPFALAVRLMANMMAGHIVLLSLFSVALLFGGVIMAGPWLMALALTFLEIFVAFLQAYVFVVLSSVFIGLIRHAH